VTNGSGVIGIRIPSNKEALDLLKFLGKPLLVPSANRADEKPAMSDSEVEDIFGKEIAVIIPGQAKSGQPSTIIDLTGNQLKVVRPGPISLQDLIACLEQ
jgi:L-threonylcarbamoyladenylate synthase